MTVLRTQNWMLSYEIFFISNRKTVLELKINLGSKHTQGRATENNLIYVIPQWLPSIFLDSDCLIMGMVTQYYAKF